MKRIFDYYTVPSKNMPVKEDLRRLYGQSIVELTSKYGRCRERIARYKNHVIFNLRCKEQGIIPRSLHVKSPIDTERGKRIASRASEQFVNERLRLTNYRLRQLEDERKWREIGLRRAMSQEHFAKIMQMSEETAEYEFNKTKEQQRRKMDRWNKKKDEYTNNRPTNPPEMQRPIDKKWVINLSSHVLTDNQRKALERGFNFATTPKTIPKEEIIASVEAALRKHRNLQPERAEVARAAIANVLHHAKPPQPNRTKSEHAAMRDLQTNKDITILQADKANATVILDTTDYEEKANALLSKPPFRQIKKDQTAKNEKRVNDCMKRLIKSDPQNKSTFERLQASANGTRPALLYGSVKTHKPGYPLRPIVSAIGTATYNTARYINWILSPICEQLPSHIKNTEDFIDSIQTLQIEDDEVMISFDIKSLFTNVPVKETTHVIENILRNDKSLHERTDLKISSIMELINLCITTTSFRFRGKSYELTDGLPMGSPASQCIADLFVSSIEKATLSTFPDAIKVWRRFVDDIFSIIKKADAPAILAHLNEQHESIEFTTEVENNDQLLFMDVVVHRRKKRLETTIHRKPTHTGRYLSYESHHPDSAKLAVAAALLKRIDYITLDKEARQKEEKKIYDDLRTNGYPQATIRKMKHKLKKTTRKTNPREQELRNETQSETLATCSIPYLRGTSEAIRRILTPLQIRTTMRPRKDKWSLMRGAKDALHADEKPGVIYALGCKECCKTYIGETQRTARQRVKEHRMHTRCGHPELSAVAQHAHDASHEIHWTARVIREEKNKTKRKVKEALAINKLNKERGSHALMNQDVGMELSKMWLNLIY